MFLFSTKHAKIIEGFIWLHFSLFQNIIGHFLKLRKDNNRISGGWFVAAACSPDLRIFSFISKKEKRNINCCALSVNIYTWTVFASLNRIANWSVIEWCWEPASITQRIFSISSNRGKLINWRKARSWVVTGAVLSFRVSRDCTGVNLVSKALLAPRISQCHLVLDEWRIACLLMVLFFPLTKA